VTSFVSAARTASGPYRRNNEDGYVDRPALGLWAVADGMGGHDLGEVASGLIVSALEGLQDPGSASALLSAAQAALERIHRQLVAKAEEIGRGAVIGSTVVILVAQEDRFACLWAGDSRAYRWRAGGLTSVTHDHSFVQELADAGVLSREAARADPRANLVTRAVGVGARLELEMAHGRVAPGDMFVLCTDGLTGALDERAIASLISPLNVDASADRLMSAALARRPTDNVTFVLAAA
jgi:serine/threonine protein phosphatase Stp1